jgi:hypothetical protein
MTTRPPGKRARPFRVEIRWAHIRYGPDKALRALLRSLLGPRWPALASVPGSLAALGANHRARQRQGGVRA